MIIAIDPGKDKCGLAVLDRNKIILERKILPREHVPNALPYFVAKYGITTVVVGRSSSGKELERELFKTDLRINVIFVSEKYSTLEARKRYWKENRPRGLMRLIPTSLRVPPVPVDDYAAVILGERFLAA
jgi:RNase H-fold protein (predicted Holliday junction resolvase)